MDIDWDGVQRFKAAIEKTVAKADAATRVFVVEGAHAVEGIVKDKANTGRHAKGEQTGASHGSGPNVVSGDLRRSIRVKGPMREARHGWSAQIGPTVAYGRRVELEYDYPYTGPGLDQAQKTVLPALAQRAWRAAL